MPTIPFSIFVLIFFLFHIIHHFFTIAKLLRHHHIFMSLSRHQTLTMPRTSQRRVSSSAGPPATQPPQQAPVAQIPSWKEGGTSSLSLLSHVPRYSPLSQIGRA